MINDLKLLYITPCRISEGMGGGARMSDMICMLEGFTDSIHLLSYSSGDKFEIKTYRRGQKFKITEVNFPNYFPKPLKSLAIPLVVLLSLLYARRTDIIFAHAPTIITGFPGKLVSWLLRKPLIIDHMDLKDPDTPKFIYNFLLKSSTCVFTISRYLENEVRLNFNDNVVYIPIFTDTNLFKLDISKRKNIRNGFNLSDHEILIGYAGSYWYVEGVSNLVKAFAKLSENYKNIRLLLIGGKNVPGSDDITKIVNDLSLNKIVFNLSPQPHETIPGYLSSCDILCCPKINCEINEAANPVKVVEYLSMGLPVVSSSIGGITEMIEAGKNGFLVEPGDVDDLQKKLEWVILNKDYARKIGINGRDSIIENYSYDSISSKVRNAIDEILN